MPKLKSREINSTKRQMKKGSFYLLRQKLRRKQSLNWRKLRVMLFYNKHTLSMKPSYKRLRMKGKNCIKRHWTTLNI